MRRIYNLTIMTLLISACEEEPTAKPTAKPQIATESKLKQEAHQVAKTEKGPDCPTFVKEVRAACNAWLTSGLDIDCHGFTTKANTAVSQASGKLFKDPTGKHDTRPAGDRMCAKYGLDLREAVNKADKLESGPNCTDLAKKLDERCFAKIGTDDYPAICRGTLIALKSAKKDREVFCKTQLVVFR